MSDVRVCIASASEYATLNTLYSRWGYQGSIADSDIVYVARIGNQAVGLVRRTLEHGLVMLRGMQVSPDHQRRGLGTKLLHALVADLPPADCYCIPFDHLPGFYSQGGFCRADESCAPEFLRDRLVRYRAAGHLVLLMRREAP